MADFTASDKTVSKHTHTHTVSGTLDSSDPIPAYRDIVVAYYASIAPTGAKPVKFNKEQNKKIIFTGKKDNNKVVIRT